MILKYDISVQENHLVREEGKTNYSATNSTGATQRFSTNHKTSLEQKN